MTQAPPPTVAAAIPGPCRHRAGPRLALCLASCALLLAGGCASWNPFQKADPATPTADGAVLRGGQLEKDAKPAPGTPGADLEAAKELYQKSEYAKAQKLFAKVADNKKSIPSMAEEGRFFEADCLRLQARYPAAVDQYKKLCKDYPSGAYQREALKHMFDIANYWLDETRDRMKAYNDQKEGKRGFIMPASFVHIDKTKPLFDEEGFALTTLEQVYLGDPIGPLGERALWFIGNVRFFHEDYKDADFYFGQIIKNYPNGEFAPKAVELSIICKQMATGGPEYDGRRVAEARKLVDIAMKSYPELASQKSEFLHRQVYTITMQEAAKDFGVAEFYERTFHPGAAYFCFEIVRRRYPGSKYAEEATKRMDALRVRAQKEQHKGPRTGPDGGGPLNPATPALGPGTPVPPPAGPSGLRLLSGSGQQ